MDSFHFQRKNPLRNRKLKQKVNIRLHQNNSPIKRIIGMQQRLSSNRTAKKRLFQSAIGSKAVSTDQSINYNLQDSNTSGGSVRQKSRVGRGLISKRTQSVSDFSINIFNNRSSNRHASKKLLQRSKIAEMRKLLENKNPNGLLRRKRDYLKNVLGQGFPYQSESKMGLTKNSNKKSRNKKGRVGTLDSHSTVSKNISLCIDIDEDILKAEEDELNEQTDSCQQVTKRHQKSSKNEDFVPPLSKNENLSQNMTGIQFNQSPKCFDIDNSEEIDGEEEEVVGKIILKAPNQKQKIIMCRSESKNRTKRSTSHNSKPKFKQRTLRERIFGNEKLLNTKERNQEITIGTLNSASSNNNYDKKLHTRTDNYFSSKQLPDEEQTSLYKEKSGSRFMKNTNRMMIDSLDQSPILKRNRYPKNSFSSGQKKVDKLRFMQDENKGEENKEAYSKIGESYIKRYERVMNEIQEGLPSRNVNEVNIFKNIDLKIRKNFKNLEREENPQKLKAIINQLELENREKDAQIIQLGMHLNDLAQIVQGIRVREVRKSRKVDPDQFIKRNSKESLEGKKERGNVMRIKPQIRINKQTKISWIIRQQFKRVKSA